MPFYIKLIFFHKTHIFHDIFFTVKQLHDQQHVFYNCFNSSKQLKQLSVSFYKLYQLI